MIVQGDSLSYLGAFLGGVLLGFSPCLYPLIPVTLSFIGVESGASLRKGLFFSLVYVAGIALTYSFLGLLAALGGRLFGTVAMHPASQLVVGACFILSGLSFLDLVRINIRAFNPKIGPGQGNIFAVIGLGLVSGLAVSPCITPVLGTILVYAASRQNIIYGATLLFVFACGMGVLLVLAGIFSAVFFSLPKSGAWLMRVKKASGLILLGMGLYFLIKAGMLLW